MQTVMRKKICELMRVICPFRIQHPFISKWAWISGHGFPWVSWLSSATVHCVGDRLPKNSVKHGRTATLWLTRKLHGMTPIAKIEIAIPIPIFIRNWDRDPDPNPNLKNHLRFDRDRSSMIAQSFGLSLGRTFFYRPMETFVIMLKKCSDVWGKSALSTHPSEMAIVPA